MKRTLFALALAAALPLSAQAGELSYNYIQGGYSAANVDGTDFNGFGLKGSFAFNENFYGFGTYDTGDGNGVDLDQTSLGAGWHTSGDTQWFAEASYVKNDIDFGGGFNSDDDGYAIAGGVRAKLSDKFELNGKLSYADVGDFGDGIGVGVGALLSFNDTWGAYGSYDYADRGDFDIDTWSLGVRASF